jgi:hypothetical protein
MKKTKSKQSIKIQLGCWILFLVGFGSCSTIFFHHALHYEASGEHISVPYYYPQDASDYCFFERSTIRYCEFNLPKDSFLKYSKEQNWEIADIEKTDVFFVFYSEANKIFNNTPKKREYTTEKPLTITRYIRQLKPEHYECSNWECKIDTTGLTENACVRSVSKGYFYKTSNSAGRGIKVLYDSEKERCYIEYSLR